MCCLSWAPLRVCHPYGLPAPWTPTTSPLGFTTRPSHGWCKTNTLVMKIKGQLKHKRPEHALLQTGNCFRCTEGCTQLLPSTASVPLLHLCVGVSGPPATRGPASPGTPRRGEGGWARTRHQHRRREAPSPAGPSAGLGLAKTGEPRKGRARSPHGEPACADGKDAN